MAGSVRELNTGGSHSCHHVCKEGQPCPSLLQRESLRVLLREAEPLATLPSSLSLVSWYRSAPRGKGWLRSWDGHRQSLSVLLEKVCSQDQGSGGLGTEPRRLFETKLGTCGRLAGWPGGEGMALHWASLSWKVNYRGATWVPPRGKGQETVTCWQLDRGWLFPK